MPYSFIKRIGMLTFLLSRSETFIIERPFQMFLFIAFFRPVYFQCRLSISHITPNLKTDHCQKTDLPVLPLCTNNALPPPWQASLITLRRAKGLGEPAASTSTVCRLEPASGLRTTARQSCNFPFVSHGTTWEHLFNFAQKDHSITSHYLFSPLPIDIVRRNFVLLKISIMIMDK